MKRDILNHAGQIIGELELPDETSEEVWAERLAQFAIPPVSVDLLAMGIKRRKEFCEDLIERLKKKNIQEGINVMQAMWMHHRMRALDVNYMGVPMTVDILNMVISGDVEVATLSLQNSVADDMSQPYHWLGQERIDWIILELKKFLGWS